MSLDSSMDKVLERRREVEDRLSDSLIDPVDLDGARIHRVRVGPFEHMAALEQASSRLIAYSRCRS